MASGNQHRLKKRHFNEALLILNRFRKEALTVYYNDDGTEKPPTAVQIKCGEMYMKRVIPELRSVEHKGKIDSKIEVSVTVE